ncbi:MAG: tRNA (adenosine(37)-N6)-threonylcarbamoyltransferase complex dimerization subunit type 1 TsaB [Gemmatimonadaceae bacterium]
MRSPEQTVLALDASTYAGSVALVRRNVVLHEVQVPMRGETEERLMPAVVAVLERAGLELGTVDAIACGAGPGSFTSLRIAGAIAKGLAVSRALPLVVASSLTLMIAGSDELEAGDYLATLDAMRGDVYAQGVRRSDGGHVQELGAPQLMTRAAAQELATAAGWKTVGATGSQLTGEPRARGFARLLESVAQEVDARTWEPLYGRMAEAQVLWERQHGRPLSSSTPHA